MKNIVKTYVSLSNENRQNDHAYSEDENKKMLIEQTLKPEYLNIGVELRGGLGDLLIASNYLNLLYKKLDNNYIKIIIFPSNDKNLNDCVFKTANYHSGYYTRDIVSTVKNKFDLFLEINRFPDILKVDKKKIYKYSKFLFDMVFEWEKFKIINDRYFINPPDFDGQNKFLILNNITRFTQPDINNIIGMSTDFSYDLLVNIDETAILKKLSLNNKKFITIHRGVNKVYSSKSTKLWPISYYNILISKIKNNYKNITIVQLGDNEFRCPPFENVDLYLAGKTSYNELKVLVKKSILHIGSEGGLIHLRHCLNKESSIVFFGPTSPDFYGYKENLNLRGPECPNPCEWMVNDWANKCPIGHKSCESLLSLTPVFVYRKIKPIMDKKYE